MANITIERLKELLEVKELQEGSPEMMQEMLETTDRLIAKYGEKWITQNKHRLLYEWDFVIDNW